MNNASSCRVYVVRNRAGRVIFAWTDAFPAVDRELCEKVVPVPLDEAERYAEPENSRFAAELSSAARKGECAWMFYPARRDNVRTVFFIDRGELFVRKDVARRAFRPFSARRFVQLAVPPLPIFKGESVASRVRRKVEKLDYAGVLEELSEFVRRLVAEYPPISPGVLPGVVFDAIPQNCIIDGNGKYNFFDLEYEMVGGGPLHYLVARAVLTTVHRFVRDTRAPYDCERTLKELSSAFGVKSDIADVLRINRLHKRFNSLSAARVLTNVLLALLPVRAWRMKFCWWSTEPYRKEVINVT